MKGQTQLVFVFILIAIVIGLMMFFAFRGISSILQKSQEVAVDEYIENIKEDVSSVRRLRGSSEVFSYNVPNSIHETCFCDGCDRFLSYPDSNLFLLSREGFVLEAEDLGTIEGKLCFNGSFEVTMEGTGGSTIIK